MLYAFSCTCPDFLIRAITCKHDHLVQRFLVANDQVGQNFARDPEYARVEINEAFEFVQDTTSIDIDYYKRKINDQLELISSKTTASVSVDAMKHLRKQLIATYNTFESMVNNAVLPEIDLKINCPSNKKIEGQSKFKSIIRKRKKKPTLPKPTQADKDTIVDELMDSTLSYDNSESELSDSTLSNDTDTDTLKSTSIPQETSTATGSTSSFVDDDDQKS